MTLLPTKEIMLSHYSMHVELSYSVANFSVCIFLTRACKLLHHQKSLEAKRYRAPKNWFHLNDVNNCFIILYIFRLGFKKILEIKLLDKSIVSKKG